MPKPDEKLWEYVQETSTKVSAWQEWKFSGPDPSGDTGVRCDSGDQGGSRKPRQVHKVRPAQS
jgi:hypothetical protein